MIQRELYMTRSDGVKLYRTYSDSGKELLQIETGAIYSEAIDVENTAYTYQEVELAEDEIDETEDMRMALSVLGVSVDG